MKTTNEATMYYIYSCKTHSLIGKTATLPEAIKLAVELLDPATTYDNYIMHDSRIVCFSDGLLSDPGPLEPYWMRGGSVMTGRDLE